MVLVGQAVDLELGWSTQSRCHAQSDREPAARDYAHSVPVQHSTALSIEARAMERRNLRAFGPEPVWYRYALPVSLTVFFLSFGIWSLHSQPNHAITPLEPAKPGEGS